jgi:anthranilate synthase component 1
MRINLTNELLELFKLEANPKFEVMDTVSTPFDIFRKLEQNFESLFIFESLDGPRELVESSIIGFDPKYSIICTTNALIVYKNKKQILKVKSEDPFLTIRSFFPEIKSKDNESRYVGGLVGYFSYEAIRLWEKIPMKTSRSFPLLEFGWYEDGIVYDHKSKKLEYFHYNDSRLDEIKQICKINTPKLYDAAKTNFRIRRSMSKGFYESKVKSIKRNLENGDIFQAVLSKKIKFTFDGNPFLMYEALRGINPSPYMFFFRNGSRIILGASPEMLLRITNNSIETYPIAGSRPVSNNYEITEKARKELITDPKEIAEHTMLVDLARNDLGKVCQFGTVTTPELMTVKKFSHIQHIVSHVIGKLDIHFDMFDAFRAVFPAGTVSGAPKIRAMEIISHHEQDSRGPYAGAIGYFSFNGGCDFAITIRSIFVNKTTCYTQSGAGIVIDSVPSREYEETEAKSMAILTSLNMIMDNSNRKSPVKPKIQ